jgi:hypothetical protein
MRIPLTVTIPAAAVATLLAGCGPFGGSTPEEPEDEQQDTNVESGTSPDSEASIGETSMPTEYGEVEVVINGLTERGELLQMDYTLTLAPDDPSHSDAQSVRRLFGAGHGENMYLVDTHNLRRHTVVEDDGGRSLEPHPWETDLEPDAPSTLTAYFASTEDMETVDVYLYTFPPIMDVPVAKEEA